MNELQFQAITNHLADTAELMRHAREMTAAGRGARLSPAQWRRLAARTLPMARELAAWADLAGASGAPVPLFAEDPR